MNTTPNRFRLPMLIAVSALSLSLIGCGGEPEPEPAEPEATVETAPRPAPVRRPGAEPPMATGPEQAPASSVSDIRYQFVPEVEGQLEQDGAGLEMIIDASSQAALNESLAIIAQDTSAQQYAELEQAIRFINTYDQSVLGSADRMREIIDGMTAQEVIDRASEIASQRYNRSNRPTNG